MGLIRIIQGDITRLPVDAVVKTCDWKREGYSDGKIGQAVLAQENEIPAKYIIHTKGPVWRGGNDDEDQLLASCYRNTLKLATENGIKTMAFPSLEEPYYKFPVRRAARIAILEISEFLEENKELEKVFIVCYDEDTTEAYMSAVKEMGCGA